MKTPNSVAPTISVLLSCYNGARWLDEAINSVLSQTFRDFEFIIVDDGSTDNSSEIIKHFAERDTRIVVISKSNTGLADSLNVGIQQARGEWIARIDADDICEPARLEMQLDKARENSSLVFIGSGLLLIDENGNAIKTFRYPGRHELLVRNLSTARKFPPHSSAFYRTNIVRSIGGYRARIRRSEDWDLWLRLSEVGQLTAIDKPLVRIRKHRGQISQEFAWRQQIDSRVAMISFWIRKKGGGDPVDSSDKIFNAFYAWLEQELVNDGLFTYQSNLVRLKGVLKSKSIQDWIKLGTKVHPLLLFRFFRERLWGESVVDRLATKWIKMQKLSIESTPKDTRE